MSFYLYSAGWVAPAKRADESGRHLADEPDYAGLIPLMQLRRMSKGVRIGIAAAGSALKSAGIARPDAISIGTAMGMLADTEVFLSKMVSQGEELLTPTAFIQSTHNTVSGQIALMIGCHGHNITYVQRGLSFEHAAVGAELYLAENPRHAILIGGLDELTPTSHTLLRAGGAYRAKGGEGAAFFLAGDAIRPGAWRVSALRIFRSDSFDTALRRFLSEHPAAANAHLVLSGLNAGSPENAVLAHALPHAGVRRFKEETGEYATASAIALTILFDETFTGSSVVLVNSYLRDGVIWWLERL